MNETNRLIIVLFAGACIVFAASVMFLTWARPDETIDRFGDVVEFLSDHNTNTGKLIVTLGGLALMIISLLVIIAELAPEDEPSELKVEQAGATTIIPADALRGRLDEALLALPEVTHARSRVWTRDRGIAARLDLTVTSDSNLASLTQEAARIVVDVVQTDLGLPVAGVPEVKMKFDATKHATAVSPTLIREEPPLESVETVDERVAATEPIHSSKPDRKPMGVVEAESTGHADASPGPLVYDDSPDEPGDSTTQS